MAITVSSSGIAATLLPRGKTAHSVFRIPVGKLIYAVLGPGAADANVAYELVTIDENSTCHWSKESSYASLFRQTSLIIWDEITLINKLAFMAVHKSMMQLFGTSFSAVMGGIPTVSSVVEMNYQ